MCVLIFLFLCVRWLFFVFVSTPRTKDFAFTLCYAIVLPGRKSAVRAGFRPDSNRASETTRSTFKTEDPSRGRTDWPILMVSQIESDRNPTRKSDFRPGMHYCVTLKKRTLENRFKSRLKAKCARRRGESAALFKNEHAAQARARWHVRSGRAGFGRRTKNIGLS